MQIKEKCLCGCGNEVNNINAKYIKGHYSKNKFKDSNQKICFKCNQLLKLDEFGIRREKQKNGSTECKPRSWCRKCEGQQHKDYIKRVPESRQKGYLYKARRRKELKFKISYTVTAYKNKDKDCDLTAEYLIDLWNKQDGKCYYTGLPMDRFVTKKGPTFDCMSLDKLTPNIGYKKGNVVYCLFHVNRMKEKMTEKEFYDFLHLILDYRGQN